MKSTPQMTAPDSANLLKSIAGKIASTDDPAQMCELTLLAIDQRETAAEAAIQPPHAANRLLQPWPVYGAAMVMCAAIFGSVLLLVRPDLAPVPSSAPINAAEMATQIFAMAKPDAPPSPASAAVKLFAAHDRDGAALIIALHVPRQICADAAVMLARQGAVTVNGLNPFRNGNAEMAHLCYFHAGDADITWSPRRI